LVWLIRRHVYFGLLIIFCSGEVSAHNDPPDTSQQNGSRGTFLQRNVNLTGDVGAYGELYGISGIPARRPSSTGRLYFRPTLSLFNAFSMSFDFLLSTEGSSARQNINQFSVNPTWGWGSAHLGDFTDIITPLIFNGILVRGGGVNLNPGLLRFSAIGGFTQRAVGGGAGNGAYSRYIYGAKIGVGKQDGSYFDISFLRARDNPSSLPPPRPTIAIITPNGNDSWPIGNIENIRWASSGIYGNVRIELSRNGGATYEVLFDSVSNTGLQPWVVTGPPTAQALIKIISLQDSVSAMSTLPFTIGIGVPDQQGNTPGIIANSFAVTPEENLVAGADTRLSLFENVVTISGEIDGSAYTRDMHASTVDSLKLPSILNGIFTPRTSSRADFAYTAEVGLNLPNFSARAGYKYIGPGYMSLGVASILSDQREITLAALLRTGRLSVALNAGHQNDNLLNQKSYTTNRNQIGGNISVPFSENWTASVVGNYLSMTNDASSDTFKVDYSTFMVGTTQTIFLGVGSFLQSASLNYILQNSTDGNPMRQGNGMISHSANVSVVFGIGNNLNIIPGFNLNDSKIGGAGWTSTQTYSLSAQHRALENRLSTSLSLGFSSAQSTNSFQIGLSSSYGITSHDAITLSAMQTFYHGTNDFNEHLVSLNLSHRF
jgi:hypothetical protein